jgi:hypothetical protein
MNEQWGHMRQVSVPATPPVKVEDIDLRPSWEPTRPTVKKEWNKSISSMKRKVTTLTEADKAALFRASQFPSFLLHVEADLKGKKPFKDAILRTNVVGACGLVLIRCGELAFSSMGKESTLMSCLHDAISGESPQDVDSLLQVLKDTKEDLIDIRKGLGKVANVGSDIAAGSFNQGVDDLRHLVWESPLQGGAAYLGALSPFPHASLRQRREDSQGLGSGSEEAISGRLLPLQAQLQPPLHQVAEVAEEKEARQ